MAIMSRHVNLLNYYELAPRGLAVLPATSVHFTLDRYAVQELLTEGRLQRAWQEGWWITCRSLPEVGWAVEIPKSAKLEVDIWHGYSRQLANKCVI